MCTLKATPNPYGAHNPHDMHMPTSLLTSRYSMQHFPLLWFTNIYTNGGWTRRTIRKRPNCLPSRAYKHSRPHYFSSIYLASHVSGTRHSACVNASASTCSHTYTMQCTSGCRGAKEALQPILLASHQLHYTAWR